MRISSGGHSISDGGYENMDTSVMIMSVVFLVVVAVTAYAMIRIVDWLFGRSNKEEVAVDANQTQDDHVYCEIERFIRRYRHRVTDKNRFVVSIDILAAVFMEYDEHEIETAFDRLIEEGHIVQDTDGAWVVARYR